MRTLNQPVLITFFGATGDLAKRKLYPALFRLYQRGMLNERFAVIGTARREWSDDFFRDVVKQSIQDSATDDEQVAAFTQHFFYQSHNVQDTEQYVTLKQLAERLDEQFNIGGNRLFYLAMAPQFFGLIAAKLKEQQLVTTTGYNRLIIEKPFGHDLESAVALNESLNAAFHEEQIYRIDHYLGKEMVQNISALRFSNLMIEALWSNHFIANVQISLSEDIGVEDRGGYYDQSGALRDMVQNHIFQILALIAMEAPSSLNGDDVRREKIKVLKALRPLTPALVNEHFVRGQYTSDGTQPGYLEEAGIAPDSRTETFVAGKVFIDNMRWSGVPFFIRTGKRLQSKEAFVHIEFKPMAMDLFRDNGASEQQLNVLTLHIQPNQGFSLRINAKKFGDELHIHPIELIDFMTDEDLKDSPDAYERLILDCIEGNPANFVHRDEVELSWQFIDKIRQAWDADTTSPIPQYPVGTMGPEESLRLLSDLSCQWQDCSETK